MNIRRPLLGIFVIAGFSPLFAADAPPAPAKAAKPAPAAEKAAAQGETKDAKKPGKKPLEKGMTGDEVIALIGKPQQVKPMPKQEGAEGKAEVWIYRRPAGEKSIQVVTGTQEVPAFNGLGQTGNDMASGTRTEMLYGNKTVKMFHVTSLLMMDGKLVLARQTQEQEENF
jgi:hypothetical protein